MTMRNTLESYSLVTVAFYAGVTSVHGSVPTGAEVHKRVMRALLARNPENYAFTSGRNWAISAQRQRAARARMALKQEQAHHANMVKLNHEKNMQDELYIILQSMRASNNAAEIRRAHALELHYLVGSPVDKWGERFACFSGMKRDALHQVKHRAVESAIKHGASDALRQYLGAKK